jgi:hypothetical protein
LLAIAAMDMEATKHYIPEQVAAKRALRVLGV